MIRERKFQAIVSGMLLLGASKSAVAFSTPRHSEQAWSNEQSIRFTYFAGEENAGTFSEPFFPVGRDFLAVHLRRGNISDNCVEDEIRFYRISDLLKFSGTPEPVSNLHLCSASNEPAISSVTTLDENNVAFIGSVGMSAPQVFKFDIASGLLARLTDYEQGVESFGSNGGSTVALVRGRANSSITLSFGAGKSVAGHSLEEFLDRPQTLKSDFRFTVSTGNKAHFLGFSLDNILVGPFGDRAGMITVSPDGKWATIGQKVGVSDLKEPWRSFILGSAVGGRSLAIEAAVQTQLVDLERGSAINTNAGPSGFLLGSLSTAKPLWSADSSTVVLPNVLYSRNGKASACVCLIHLDGSQMEVIGPSLIHASDRDRTRSKYVQKIEWVSEKKIVATYAGGDGPREVHVFSRISPGHWSDAVGASNTNNPTLFALESSSELPKLAFRVGKRVLVLGSSNPGVITTQIAQTHDLKWRDGQGQLWTAGLTKGSKGGATTPLVVQIYDYDKDRFRPDGPNTTAYATQSLAARGFAVLNVPLRPCIGTENEGACMLQAVEGAIEVGGAKGLFDPNKVGLIGFSRAGYSVRYMISHPHRVHFGAAVEADSATFSLVHQMLVSGGTGNGVRLSEIMKMNGGTAFWLDKEVWLERNPEFNIEKIHTPLLIQAIGGRTSLLAAWETYSGLLNLKKPVDLIYLPNAVHAIRRPDERMVSLDGSVDWLTYWLLGLKDPVASKAEQYKRWDRMQISN